ncbi:hypothetical protein LGM35_06460 [Burkholderia cenocepacia]|uniref:hypothetical protein n=1 Tax=Burkholderia cenocepacia TaxID=95486 RepID=UPI001CF4D5BE|nr:hypothetical protein [Burkholderia cenocepacia]MCA7922123.1 hypothetical protein [Burkholderia cenocepacia]
MSENFSYEPLDFASLEYAEEFSELFDRFIELCIQGIPGEDAIIDAFEMIQNGARLHNAKELARAARANPYFKTRFPAQLKKARPADLWNTRKAINYFLTMALDPNVRDTVRFNAARELGVLTGITIVDENGQTRRAEEMAGLLDKIDADLDAKEASQPATRH